MRLLLVEDEKQLSEALTQLLIKNNFTVDAVYDGEEGLDAALSDIYDVIILDIMLPKINGIAVLEQIRQEGISTPIILLTAKSQVEDKVEGLDKGADDYLAKPFSPEELLARLRALSRRKGEIFLDNAIALGDCCLDLSTCELEGPQGRVRLTMKEVEIMQYFLYRPNMVVDKEDIIVKVWGYDSQVEHNNLEVYISFLRKKLQHIGSSVSITTFRGIGYKLEG